MSNDTLARALALSGPRILYNRVPLIVNTGNTTLNTLITIPIPAGLLGLNGALEIEHFWEAMTNTANAKTPTIKLGGTIFANPALSSVTSSNLRTWIQNAGATNAQRAQSATATSPYGATGIGAASAAGTEDTTTALNLTVGVQLALGTETITLRNLRVLFWPGV